MSRSSRMLCAPLPLAIFALVLSSPVQAQSVAPAADQAAPADGQDDGAIVVTGTYARSLADIQAQKALAESVMLEGKAGFRPE